MRISWKWLSELVDLSKVKGPEELADILTNRGLEVEAIERQDQGFEKVVTAQILERDPHPNSDRLSLCKVTIGSGDPLEIVCGAQNMKAGDKVALAQIGADLPNGVKIAQSKIRGVTSNGMLCSEQELKIADTSEGIMILPPSTPLGRPLAEILGRDDTVLVFKLTANRGDCMSHWGMAREVAAALGVKPKSLETKLQDFGKGAPIAIRLEAGEGAPQFYGISIDGVKVGPSPDWVVKRLESVGSRSINNVVDATNLVMLELGHPMHAYDADRIEGGEIRVRMAKAGEQLPLLDGATVTLAGTELVIADGADGKRAVGLAGVMGGGNSEVRDTTTRLFLESAEFNPGLVRKAAARHQRRTEAAQRFEKGIDPAALPLAISRLAERVTQLAGGTIRGATFKALPSRDPKQGGLKPREIGVRPSYLAAFLGMDVSAEECERILAGLDCQVRKAGDDWAVALPSYRRDLQIPEDLAEEVARSAGYDRIRETVPPLTTEPRTESSNLSAARIALIEKAKDVLMAQGLNETINLAFTGQAWLDKFGFKQAVRVLNPLSEEHEAMVPSLVPGLVRNALTNWHHHFGSEALAIRLFELRPTFEAGGALEARSETETTAVERWKLAFVVSGPRYSSGLRNEQGEADFYDIKAIVEALIEGLGARGVRFSPMTASRSGGNPLFHPGQSVEILAGNAVAGAFGLLHPAKARELKCRAPLWVAEIDWEALSKLSRPASEPRIFKAWPEFPSIERDFALLVRNDVTADKITQLAIKAGKPLAKVAKVFDVYRGQQVAEGMTSVAVRVIFYEEARSLQESEAEAASAQILETWKKELGAELRG